MQLGRGTKALMGARKQQVASGGGGQGFKLLIYPEDGSVPVRFGAQTDDFESEFPVLNLQHFLPNRGKDSYQNCAMYYDGTTESVLLMPGHAGCVFHQLGKDNGGTASQQANYWVQDRRRMHRLDYEVQQNKGKTKYPYCMGRNCTYCAQGNEAKMVGWRTFKVAAFVAEQQITPWVKYLADFCRCGARPMDGEGKAYGTIAHEGFLCGNLDCYQPLEGDSLLNFTAFGHATVTCEKCRQTTKPVEWVSCSANCAYPARVRMQDVIFDISVTGGKKQKAWSITPRPVVLLMDDHQIEEMNKFWPNWDAEIAPKPAEMMAALVGIPNPFPPVPGHGAKPYDPGVYPGETQPQPAYPPGPSYPVQQGSYVVDTGPEYSQVPPRPNAHTPVVIQGSPVRPVKYGAGVPVQKQQIQLRPAPSVAIVRVPQPIKPVPFTPAMPYVQHTPFIPEDVPTPQPVVARRPQLRIGGPRRV